MQPTRVTCKEATPLKVLERVLTALIEPDYGTILSVCFVTDVVLNARRVDRLGRSNREMICQFDDPARRIEIATKDPADRVL